MQINGQKGQSAIEVLLAGAVFITFASGITGIVVQSLTADRAGIEQNVAVQYAVEGIEGVRSIKNQDFSGLINNASTGISIISGVWAFNGTNNTFDSNKYTRTITISDVNRDGSSNIVASGGTLDPDSKKVTSTVTWNASAGRNNSISLKTYLTNWRVPFSTAKGGMLAYADGGTTTDTLKYRILDATTSTWGTVTSAADIDSLTTNKVPRVVRIYSSPTRNEKIMISRHRNSTTQFIYAQVWNGISWGNVQLLSSWAATTFLDVQNFDGAYTADGNFTAVFSDNTIIPKSRKWNGTSWLAQTSLTTLGTSQIPNYVVLKARPATNEIMAAFFTQGSDAITQYWSGSAWSSITTHSTTAVANTRRTLDFEWSPNDTTKGFIGYSGASARRPSVKIFTANGSGGGTWSAAASYGVNLAGSVGTIDVTTDMGATGALLCTKDSSTAPRIYCFRINSTPAFVTTTNNAIVAGSDTGIQASFATRFELSSGNQAIVVYSDNTAVPKLKKFNKSTVTWDASATSIATTPNTLTSPVRTVRMAQTTTDNIMVFFTDSALDVYSIMWDGTADAMATTPSGYAITKHGTNGSATTDFWYDFAWDIF